MVAVIMFALTFVARARRLRAWPFFVAATAWAAIVPWEYHCKASAADIRIDLLFICPLLFIITAGALISGFFRPRSSGHTDDSNARQAS